MELTKEDILSFVLKNNCFSIKELASHFNIPYKEMIYLLNHKFKLKIKTLKKKMIINDIEKGLSEKEILRKYKITSQFLRKNYYKMYDRYSKFKAYNEYKELAKE